jgi:hypothetical protein
MPPEVASARGGPTGSESTGMMNFSFETSNLRKIFEKIPGLARDVLKQWDRTIWKTGRPERLNTGAFVRAGQ